MPDTDPTAAKTIYPDYRCGRSGLRVLQKIRRDPLAFFADLAVEGGTHAWLKLMGHPVLFLNDATAIQHVFQETQASYLKGRYNESLRPLFGFGILLSEGALWKRQRRDIAPVFANGNFPEFTKQIGAAVDAMCRRWEKHAESGEPININVETMLLALDVILRALFHEESEAAVERMQGMLGVMLRLAERRIWAPISLPLAWELKLPKYRRSLRFLDSLVQDLIREREQDRAYPEDLLSRLINTHVKTPEDQRYLRDNILSFLIAGHETTANGLAWTFYELAKRNEIRAKIVAEVDRVAGGVSELTYDHIKQMDYTRWTFHESLRLYPPIWTMSRETLNDHTLPLDNGDVLHVPKDVTIMLCAHTVHRNENYWQHPEAFDPERFSPEQSEGRPKGCWFPFGGGHRLCLGFKFAEIEGIAALAKVYQKFDLHLIPSAAPRAEPIITVRPDRPVLFRVVKRGQKVERPQAVSVQPPPARTGGKCPFH